MPRPNQPPFPGSTPAEDSMLRELYDKEFGLSTEAEHLRQIVYGWEPITSSVKLSNAFFLRCVAKRVPWYRGYGREVANPWEKFRYDPVAFFLGGTWALLKGWAMISQAWDPVVDVDGYDLPEMALVGGALTHPEDDPGWFYNKEILFRSTFSVQEYRNEWQSFPIDWNPWNDVGQADEHHEYRGKKWNGPNLFVGILPHRIWSAQVKFSADQVGALWVVLLLAQEATPASDPMQVDLLQDQPLIELKRQTWSA